MGNRRQMKLHPGMALCSEGFVFAVFRELEEEEKHETKDLEEGKDFEILKSIYHGNQNKMEISNGKFSRSKRRKRVSN